jgi:pimeloyl-ACP methyl ester carboxylesterase
VRTFIYARDPLVHRLGTLPKRIPVLVLFGDNDWLYYPPDQVNRDIQRLREGSANSGGEVVKEVEMGIIAAASKSSSSSSRGAQSQSQSQSPQGGLNITLAVIRNAGHYLYLDNSEDFHSTILNWLKREKAM